MLPSECTMHLVASIRPGAYIYFIVILSALTVCRAEGFSMPGLYLSDSTQKICDNAVHYTAGSTPPSNEKVPYIIKINMTKYVPGHAIEVSITGEKTFRGIILQVRQIGISHAVGTFLTTPEELIATRRIVDCKGDKNTILITYDTDQKNATFVWSPPLDAVGTVQVMGTIFENDDTFWENVTSKRFRKGLADIDLSTCGIKKGCFRYSETGEECSPDTCDYLVTYQTIDQEAKFEIMGKADWAAIGFSSDNKMGGDDVAMCLRVQGSVEVRHYTNHVPYQAPEIDESMPIEEQETEISPDGKRIVCVFRRLLRSKSDNQFIVDLANDWYQLYAWGPTSHTGTPMRHSLAKPPTSKEKVTLSHRRNEISRAASIFQRSFLQMSIYVTIVYGIFNKLTFIT